MNSSDKEQERELFRQLVDGRLPESEFSAVEQRLLTDAGFRERYVCAIHIESGLYEACRIPGHAAVSVASAWSKIKLISVIAAGTTVFYCVIACLLMISNANHPNAKDFASLSSTQSPVATVTRAQHLDENLVTSFEPGMLAIPGILKINRGQIQLEFLNGVQLNVEGAVELHLLSPDSARLIAGKAAVRRSSGAPVFVLNVPDASISNLDAEFAVAVNKHGESEIQVVSGEITVALLDKKGDASKTLIVTKGESLRVNRNTKDLEPIDAPTVDLPKIETHVPAPPRIRTRHCNILPFTR